MLRRVSSRTKPLLRRLLAFYSDSFQTGTINQILVQQEARRLLADMRERTPDNPALAGYKVYSQTDEDGIIAEVFRRTGPGGRVFVEIGCGVGIENNTHAALLDGWRGVWVDGSRENIGGIGKSIPLESPKLHVRCEFVTRDNIAALIADAQARYDVRELDLLSMDIDGNDLFVLQRVLEYSRPRVVVAEYNGKFPPPLKLSIAYNPRHTWNGDDYYGASLQSLVDGLPGYRLVACNLAGANAFFVRQDLAGPFTGYSIDQLYQPPRYHLMQARYGEPSSMKMLADVLAG